MKKPSKNQKYEKSRKDKGLKKVTVWLPDEACDDLKEMCNYICEQYLQERKILTPFMFRDLNNGRMGRPK